jgi:alcohol dehydrogenase class IV
MSEIRLPKVLRFGTQSLQTLVPELKLFNPSHIGLISDKGLEKTGIVKQIVMMLEEAQYRVTTYTEIAGEPTFSMLTDTIRFMRDAKCDLIIGLGGGSAMDVAKATAALMDKDDPQPYIAGTALIPQRTVPCIVLPTTSGTGSEVTYNAIFGDEANEVKRGIVSHALLPDAAIVDPLLTLSCPPRVTASSGVDAFTHAIEAYLAVRATPLTKMYAEQAMKLFAPNIAKAVHFGRNVEGRVGMSMVSLLAGIALGNAGVGAVHALAYPLGGKYHIEHGVANALLMPYVFDVTASTCVEAFAEVANYLQLGDYTSRPYEAPAAVVAYLYRLLGILDLPSTLRELGVDEASLPAMAHQASNIDRLLSNTPYRLTEQKILQIYCKAYTGF